MRLRTKYALVLLVILLVLGGVVLGSTELFKQQAIAQEREDLSRTANQTGAQVSENVHEMQDQLATFAAEPEMANFSRNDRLMEEFVSNTVFNQVVLIDRNGTITRIRGNIRSGQREDLVGRNVSNQTFFRDALRAIPHVSRPSRWVRGSLTGDTSPYEVTFSAPIYYRSNNSAKGVLRGTLRISRTDFFDPLRGVSASAGTRAYVYAVANTSERVVLNQENRTFEDPLTENATIETAGWDLVLARDRARLTDRLQTLQFIQGGSLLAVLVSLVGLGVWQYRTNLRQTERLLDGFDALTQGRFDYRLRMRAAEEWRQIGAGFNNLAKGLHEREQAIQEREQRLSVLNRVLRHNLQNDLTVVQGYAEMLTEFEDDEIERAQSEIMAKVDGLIEHGQKARRIEDALESAEEGPVDIDVVDVVDDLLDDYAAEYPDVDVSRDLPAYAYVSAISTLQFGVESIVENAFEHNTSEDPAVAVAVERVEDTVEVRVSDNGPGIPEHEYQVLEQEEETALEHGSGIGMWLAYWVVEKSRGELRFDQSGEGVTVTMVFPVGETPKDPGGDDDLLDF